MIKLDKYKKLTAAAIVVYCLFIVLAGNAAGPFTLRIFNLSGIYVILALSLNLLNGFTGLFSLGHAGFMAIGAYVSALLTMSPAQKEMNFFMKPIVPFLANVEMPFVPALVIAGAAAASLPAPRRLKQRFIFYNVCVRV